MTMRPPKWLPVKKLPPDPADIIFAKQKKIVCTGSPLSLLRKYQYLSKSVSWTRKLKLTLE